MAHQRAHDGQAIRGSVGPRSATPPTRSRTDFNAGERRRPTQTMINPRQPAAIAGVKFAERFLPSPPHMTGPPRPAAMRASKAIPTTTIIRMPPRAFTYRTTRPGYCRSSGYDSAPWPKEERIVGIRDNADRTHEERRYPCIELPSILHLRPHAHHYIIHHLSPPP